MIVLYWMTPDPLTITEEDSLLKVWRILRGKHIRRLPVVQGEDRVVGMVGRADILRIITKDAYLGPESAVKDQLVGTKVGEVMAHEPATCEVGDHLEEVSERLRQLKVGALPVLHRGHLVGIISETDIFRALSELAWHDSGASRITVKSSGESDLKRTFEITDLCRKFGLELLAVLTHPVLEDSAMMTTLRVRGEKVAEFTKELWKAGFNVVDES